LSTKIVFDSITCFRSVDCLAGNTYCPRYHHFQPANTSSRRANKRPLGCPGVNQETPGPSMGQRWHQDSGTLCGREVRSDPRLPCDNRCRQDCRPAGGRDRRSGQRGFRVGNRTRGANRTDGGGKGKVGRGGIGSQLFSLCLREPGEALSYRFSFVWHLKAGSRHEVST